MGKANRWHSKIALFIARLWPTPAQPFDAERVTRDSMDQLTRAGLLSNVHEPSVILALDSGREKVAS